MNLHIVIPALLMSAAALLAPLSVAHGQANKDARKPSALEKVQKTPLLLYLAKGEHDACGKDCSEWIAIEGHFDKGAADRFRTFVRRTGNRNLPVVFHSPGGDLKNALAIGRMLRKRGTTVSAGLTLPDGCTTTETDACKAIKRSGKPVQARLVAAGGQCMSACVWALLGGAVREAPPGSILGVHASRQIITVKSRPGMVVPRERVQAFARIARQNSEAQTRGYFAEMGIALDLLTLANSIPHESVRHLTRDEIVRFGIDRREFQETRWTTIPLDTRGPVIFKHFVENRGAGTKEFKTSYLRMYCAGANTIRIDYIRGLALHEISLPAKVSVTFGDRQLALRQTGRATTNTNMIGYAKTEDTQSQVVPFAFGEAAARAEQLTIVEDYRTASGAAVRAVKLRNDGLAGAIELLRPSCSGQI